MSSYLRLFKIIKTALHYGLDEKINGSSAKIKFLKLIRKALFWIKNQHSDLAYGMRLRLALQELGPVWIKLGQMLSTRRDLFNDDIAEELALLQDQVAPFPTELARAEIEKSLKCKIEDIFSEFSEKSMASASIAQVHSAKFKDNHAQFAGQEVVFKVIRPGIEHSIKSDLKLMYSLAALVPKINAEGHRLRAVEVVEQYEKTIINELDLRIESANAIRLKQNFKDSETLYVPKIYNDYCSRNLIVMERIYGIQISDIQTLHSLNFDMKLLAERGVQIFFTQVFRDSFFHADMHPGNIYVSYNNPQSPQYIALDCGIVGTLNADNKRYIAENFLAFFHRDYAKVSQLHVDSGWVPADTNLEEFEQAIRTVCDPIFAKPLDEISFGNVLIHLFSTARQFKMQVQPQLVLLQKTLLYIEGLGRQIYPKLDLWQTAMPFLQKWLDEQVGVRAFIGDLKKQILYMRKYLPIMPELLVNSLQNQQKIEQEIENFKKYMYKNNLRSKIFNLKLLVAFILSLGIIFKSQQLSYNLNFLLASITALLFITIVFDLYKK